MAATMAALWILLAAGCGLQTDVANEYLKKANVHQAKAEEILGRLKVLSNDWQTIFNVEAIGPAQVAQAQDLIKAREADLDALNQELKDFSTDVKEIGKLNVEEKIKEYSKLKAASIKQWEDYTDIYMRPLVKGYEGLLNTIALGRPPVEQEQAAANITALTSEALSKLEDCITAQKQADAFFKNNKLGN